jgi:hypothetical protein
VIKIFRIPKLPVSWVEWLARRRILTRPAFLCIDVGEAPLDSELNPNYLYREIRDGFHKWAHFKCPRCGEHIQVPVAKGSEWRIGVDWLRRPTLHPSIWETQGCGAHFFVQQGRLLWCP